MARILLVDDDAGLLAVLTLAFGDAGHEVVCAGDGRAALIRLEQGDIELLVTDVNMPELDGFALVRTLRGRGDALPILVLTARDDEIDEALGLELGADDYVTKPFSNRVLISRVAALLRRQAIRGGAPVEPPSAARRIGAAPWHSSRRPPVEAWHALSSSPTNARCTSARPARGPSSRSNSTRLGAPSGPKNTSPTAQPAPVSW